MQWAPLVFNLAAIMVQILPVMLLNGGRGRALVPSSTARLVLSVLYIAQPYTAEVHANLTNAQWHLAVSAALLCCLDGWQSWRQAVFDVALVVLSCLSGPFCILLLPCVAWLAYRRRDRRTVWLLALILVGACIQLALAVPQMGPAAQSDRLEPLGRAFCESRVDRSCWQDCLETHGTMSICCQPGATAFSCPCFSHRLGQER